jgi:creatinine amidohydrolase
LILPVGSCVQHGPHLPVGTDEIITTAIAEGIATRHSVLLGPTLRFGTVSSRDKAYAGTAGLSAKTLHRVLNELIADWEKHGVREFTLLTSHGYGSNYGALVSAISTRARIRAVDTNVVDLSPVVGPDALPERAGEVETSLMLHLAPSLVRLDLARDEIVDARVLDRLLDGSEPMPLRGSAGVIGRPTAAAAEKGKRIYDYLVAYIGDRLFAEDAIESRG